MYKIIVICLDLLMFSLVYSKNYQEFKMNNCIDKKDSIVYYSEKTVIFWCPTDKELEDATAVNYSQEEEMDDIYYNTEALTFIREHKMKCIIDTSFSFGFIINKQDTIIINKLKYRDVDLKKGFLWKIILFDGKTYPIVISPIDITDEQYFKFFNK